MPIINGVKVEGCYYMYDNEDLNYMCQNGIGTCICRENKNCYYKQLQRVKAENAELKNRLMILDEEAITVQITAEEFEEFKNLKNENAKLKEESEQLKNNLDVAYIAMEQTEKEIGCIKKINRDLLATVNDYREDIKELKQILQKIKEIAENLGSYTACQEKKIDKILTLIKKAEEE